MVLNNRCKMTFHDPALIQITHTRGRRIVVSARRHHHPVDMFSKIIFCLVTVLHLMPAVSSSSENFTTELTSERPDLEDSAPLNSTASTIITFIDVPQHTETPLGGSVLLACRTAEPVKDCKWSWTPLPPVNLPHPDVSPSQLASTIEVSSEIIADSSSTLTNSVAVCQFRAFGNNSNDCSVRFTHAKYEQIGYWTCAARSSENDTFVSTDPAMLNIASDTLERLITFSDVEDVEAPVGASSQIICRTKTRVSECQWTWRLFNQTELWNLEVKKFPAFGQDQTDCSIKFKNVLAEQEGVWTCGARSDTNATFVQAKPVRFFVLEVEFVQLSRGIQIAAGESALLRCLVDKPVVQCEWSWKPLNSSKAPTVLNKFVPNNDNEHDCSVRFKNVVYEDEGLWTCGVRLTRFGHLHEAPPAKLTLLPSAKINFLELPDNKSVVATSHDVFKCAASNRVSLCTWLWRPLTNEGVEASVMHEFPGLGSLGNNCSLELTKIRIEDEGYWACRVTIATSNSILTSPYAKIIVYSQDKIEFSELSQDIQITSGSSVFLRCVTSSAVEQCRWSLTPVNSNTTVVVKQFPAVGAASRDCSVRLSHALAEQEGLWTCGVKAYGIDSYLNAPPAKLSLLDPGIIGS